MTPTGTLREIQPARDLSGLRIDDTARNKRSFKWLRWLFAAIGLLLVIGGAVSLVRGRAPEVEVATAHVNSGNARATLLNASGYVTPRRRATVAAKITGLMKEIYVDEGMRVKAGQVVAVLDQSDYEKQLLAAKADRDATQASLADLRVNLANAERDLRRTEGLHTGGVTSDQALDTARTTVDSLKARIASTETQVRAAESRIQVAQQNLDNTVVRAPFDGIVVSKDAQRGEMVSPMSEGGGFTRTGIATIVDMNSDEIEVDVNEAYIARVKPGMPVSAVLDAYPDWQIPSHVRTVIPTADRQKATVKVRISFDKLDPRILPDMGVKVAFLSDEPKTSKTAANQIVVPKSAVRNEGGQQSVLIYKEGHVEHRAIRAGATRGDDQVVVLAGISDGDQVVVGG